MKKIYITVYIVIILSMAFGVFLLVKKYQKDKTVLSEEEREANMERADYLSYLVCEKKPTDIIWFGTPVSWDKKAEIRYETVLSADTMAKRKDFPYAIIVVNDLDGKCEIDEDGFREIFRLVSGNSRYMFCYLGREKLPLLLELEYSLTDSIDPDDYSLFLSHVDGKLVTTWGTYTSQNVELESNPLEQVINYIDYSFYN